LAITRSLGKSGHWIAVGAETRTSLAGASKYCAESFTYDSPFRSIKAAAQQLSREVMRRNIACLIPAADVSLIPILTHQETLFNGVSIPYPPLQIALQASDKRFLFPLAQKCGVPIPRTIYCDQPVRPGDIYSQISSFPVIVKSARSLFVEADRLVHGGVSCVSSREELRRLLAAKDYLHRHSFLVQERIFGTGMGYFVLLHQGKPLAEFSHRRIREKPPAGGVSVYSESTPLRSDIREFSLKLLNSLAWSGIAMVEFKLDRRTNLPMLMEINGRFWGSLQLAIDAGIDFPTLLVNSISNGAEQRPQVFYKPYIRWRWLLGDLDNMLLRCLKPDKSLSLPPLFPSRPRTVMQFLSAFGRRHTGYDTLDRSDMRPFLFELRSYLNQLSHDRTNDNASPLGIETTQQS